MRDWREEGMPWPVSWKKPVPVQAVFTSWMTLREAGEVGSNR